MVCIILFVSGLQPLCIGLLSQYLAKTYLEVKQRPIYILKEDSREKKLKIRTNKLKKPWVFKKLGAPRPFKESAPMAF